jgi:hypothetical protein
MIKGADIARVAGHLKVGAWDVWLTLETRNTVRSTPLSPHDFCANCTKGPLQRANAIAVRTSIFRQVRAPVPDRIALFVKRNPKHQEKLVKRGQLG